ncbi:LON peptidase substrate-binding domain-containing protein [Spirosoma sp. KUDC1026]|uniref:LON peptidase substrate-binding domain-containing protein n=1 Tax=Spirosoma sp. KUDC1026 TaxID=2745947 RepID=UPI00159B9B6F|nr:LON peptidase substrate-binding domain-containing protein [Spirosoma sp. KUDC1026]QKZ11728.1 LON peptidase substrate-binding domain-containing protein [Spirosoma sp. KUDC1026]
MENVIPLFPLNLVVYPGEDLNLHIFEPRYRQLINECIDEEKTFGIPVFIDNKLPGYGTIMHVTTLHKRYPDGRMDIKSKGISVFKLVNFENPLRDKLYAGGEVEIVEPGETFSAHNSALIERLDRLYKLLEIDTDYNAAVKNFSYKVAHKVGLSIEQEYELLTIDSEAERQLFLIQHLNNVLPVVSDMERTKQRIRMNGHFKNLDPLNF